MSIISHANRGSGFEELIDYANEQYAQKGWAQVQKVATPWQIIRKGKQIVTAFPSKKSTVDYIGVANGKAIAFDAKSTRERTRFPLSNIAEHQINFLKDWQDQGGKAFFLIEFVKHGEVFFAEFTEIKPYWDRARNGGRKSIAYRDFEVHFPLVTQGRGVALDYLRILAG